MLVQFRVGNFRSFKEIATLSLVAARVHARHKELETNLFAVDDELSLLKSAVIYGANASGKSNLLKAIAFMRDFVINSARESASTDPIPVEPFALSTETENQPSFFEVVFYLAQRRYRYGFIADRQRIHEEWLYHTQKRETKLFTRVGKQFSIAHGFKEGQGLIRFVRDNALFLSVVDQWNGPLASQIVLWFNNMNIISGLDDNVYLGLTLQQLVEKGYLYDDIIRFVAQLDTGIVGLSAERVDITEDTLPSSVSQELRTRLLRTNAFFAPISTKHVKFNRAGDRISSIEFSLFEHESEGTQKIVALAGTILAALRDRCVLLIDEMDARLHPLITKEIIRVFHSQPTHSQYAQLIFATHDTNLLSSQLFRRDQVWFTEKDQYGATDLYSLAEFKVRQDASFASDYMMGRYGAIPYLGNIEQFVSQPDEA